MNIVSKEIKILEMVPGIYKICEIVTEMEIKRSYRLDVD